MSVPDGGKKGAPAALRAVLSFRLHWHVLLVHFPVSFFMISALFMTLHIFTDAACFERSAFICLAAGAAVALPAALSGWLTWKKRYKGARTKIFLRKLYLSFVIIFLSLLLVSWRVLFPTTVHTLWHDIYYVGIVLLFAAVSLEGFYGGRLNHR